MNAFELAALRKQLAKYHEALRKISEFGQKNPGFGYSCGKIAKAALSTK